MNGIWCLQFIFLLVTVNIWSLDHMQAKQAQKSYPFSSTHMHAVNKKNASSKKVYRWNSGYVPPFSELILSWNALRPKKGFFEFKVSLFYDGIWSPLKRLAEWGHDIQKTFGYHGLSHVHTKYVRVEMQKKAMAQQFKIEVSAHKGACLSDLHALFVSASYPDGYKKNLKVGHLKSVMIKNIPPFSQWVGKHPRCKDFCSPTSTSMIVRYFKKEFLLEDVPHRLTEKELVSYADKVHDQGLDIYGNWLMNVAQAYQDTLGKVFFSVRRLNDFESLHQYLCNKIPVAVSIRGTIKGGFQPHNNGHFLVVIGWDQKNKMVQCLDPAFKKISQVKRSYAYDDFITAWGRSRNLSYVALLKSDLIS